MKKVHFIMQGKGGVGKSFVASLLAQYHLEKSLPVVCVDADPINATFSRYQAFGAKQFDLMENNEVELAKCDELIESMLEEDSHFVVDTGVASFLPMCNYLIGYGAVESLAEAGKTVVIHTIVTGGQAMLDTLENFSRLASQLPEAIEMMVWLNEHFGPVSAKDKEFEQMKAYQEHGQRIQGIIRLPKQESLFGRNVKTMLEKWLTFDEAITGHDFRILERQRLTMVRRSLFEQMSAVMKEGVPA
jgi:hypothetical protein